MRSPKRQCFLCNIICNNFVTICERIYYKKIFYAEKNEKQNSWKLQNTQIKFNERIYCFKHSVWLKKTFTGFFFKYHRQHQSKNTDCECEKKNMKLHIANYLHNLKKTVLCFSYFYFSIYQMKFMVFRISHVFTTVLARIDVLFIYT